MIPGLTTSKGSPSPATARSAATLSLPQKRSKKPSAASIAVGLAFSPAAARRAARTPFWAASPACSGLVMVPKLARRPQAVEAAIARAWAQRSVSRPSRLAAAAAAPSEPSVEVVCQPRS
jgi:hypothetical protein